MCDALRSLALPIIHAPIGSPQIVVFLLWLIDKFVFYYLAQSDVDEVAKVLDLNVHLANALVLTTFVVAVFFAKLLWSFSSQRRFIGIIGIFGLLIGHSLVLWYATRDKPFDQRGNAVKCYVLTRDGQVSYGEHVGIDPATGRQCRPLTVEMWERLQKYAAGKRPQRVTASNPVFFDPRSGEPIIWYSKAQDGSIEIFDLMGFHPNTGEELLPATKEVAEQWKKQEEEKARRIPKLIPEPDKYVFFDPLNGQARGWYWQGGDGRYEFYDSQGYHPQTGDKLQVVTRDILDDWQNRRKDPTAPVRVPNRVKITTETVFFDPLSGNPKLWYWQRDRGDYEFFDGPGFHPQNGQALQSFTREILKQYQQEIDERTRQLKAEQERIERERKAKLEAEEKKKVRQEEEQRKREEEAKRLSEAALKCDQLAANPVDPHRVGNGVPYKALKFQAAEAVDACETARTQNPGELRFQYQLARALELAGDGQVHAKNRHRAFEIHQRLVKAGYISAFDNLADLYMYDRNDLGKGVAILRQGIELGDSDSMLTLAQLIENGSVTPQSPNETPLELYKRAADLGNENGARAYQQLQQGQALQLEQQKMMLQFMGNVLNNVRR